MWGREAKAQPPGHRLRKGLQENQTAGGMGELPRLTTHHEFKDLTQQHTEALRTELWDLDLGWCTQDRKAPPMPRSRNARVLPMQQWVPWAPTGIGYEYRGLST